jgi:hypothetical protein
MDEHQPLPLDIVDGLTLDDEAREVLRPGEMLHDQEGRARRLPRFFYKIDSWKTAEETKLAPEFSLYEFIVTDVREAEPQQTFPQYIPCAVTLLAAQLSLFRERVDTFVHIAANGGYRSPAHELSRHATRHHWATAVNIYRVGDDYLEDRDTIEHYAEIAQDVLPSAWLRPYGHAAGYADDHLHIDLGYVTVVPHEAPGEREPDA